MGSEGQKQPSSKNSPRWFSGYGRAAALRMEKLVREKYVDDERIEKMMAQWGDAVSEK